MNIKKAIKAQIKHNGKVLHIPGKYSPIDLAPSKPEYIRATLCIAAQCEPHKGFAHKCRQCLFYHQKAFEQWQKKQLAPGGLNV
jgi:hypothetical protein